MGRRGRDTVKGRVSVTTLTTQGSHLSHLSSGSDTGTLLSPFSLDHYSVA